MKKVLAFVLAVVLALSLFGCDIDNTQSQTSDEQQSLIDKYNECLSIYTFYGVEWESPEDIPPDKLIFFYYYNSFPLYLNENPTNERYLSVSADTVENYIKKYFDISTEHLRKSTQYNYNTIDNTYSFDTDPGFGNMSPIISKIEKDNDLIKLYCINLNQLEGYETLDRYYVITIKEIADDNYKFASGKYRPIY